MVMQVQWQPMRPLFNYSCRWMADCSEIVVIMS